MSELAPTIQQVESYLQDFVAANRTKQPNLGSREELNERLGINSEFAVPRMLAAAIKQYGKFYRGNSSEGYRFEGKVRGMRVAANAETKAIQPKFRIEDYRVVNDGHEQIPNEVSLCTSSRRVPLIGTLSIDRVSLQEDGQDLGSARSGTRFNVEFYTPELVSRNLSDAFVRLGVEALPDPDEQQEGANPVKAIEMAGVAMGFARDIRSREVPVLNGYLRCLVNATDRLLMVAGSHPQAK